MFRVQSIALIGRHLFGVINAAHDNGLIGITLHKSNQNFLTYSRPKRRPPAFTGKRLADSDPARTIFVFLAQAIPIKLHLHPTVFVDKDFLTGWTDHQRILNSRDEWHRSLPLRPVGKL